MRATNRKRALLISGAVILLCMTIIVGMTWALFTDEQKVSNHLQAGDLTVTLKRLELTKTTLNKQGYLVEDPVQLPGSTPEDFTNAPDKNVFDITADEKIVPGTKYVAKMQIENNSDVAFDYWIDIVCKDSKDGAAQDGIVLGNQLKVTVTTDKDNTAYVGNGLSVGSKDVPIGKLDTDQNKVATFTVTVEFLHDAANNQAKGESLDFDLLVSALQRTNP